MQLMTKYFGEITYESTDVLSFPQGLFGFEEEQGFLLLPFPDSDGSLLCFQSLRTPELAFIAMNPFLFKPDYTPLLEPHALQEMGVTDSRDLCYYVLCVVKQPIASSTVNLKCPVVINDESRVARQVILDTPAYEMRHLLSEFSHKGGGQPC